MPVFKLFVSPNIVCLSMSRLSLTVLLVLNRVVHREHGNGGEYKRPYLAIEAPVVHGQA
jgi:hypothetical protein